jgi:hypothetical protein
MSAIQMIITNLQSLNDAERAQVLSHFGSKSVPAPKQVGVTKDMGATKAVEKKPRANAGQPTAHGAYTAKVLAEHNKDSAEFKDFLAKRIADAEAGKMTYNAEQAKVRSGKKAVGDLMDAKEALVGAHIPFASMWKRDHQEEWLAFKADFEAKNSKTVADDASVAESAVLESAVGEAKPKRVMSDEQKAKMKAGREAAKAKKEADAARVVAVSTMAELMGHGEVPDDIAALAAKPELKKRGPKKLEDMTAEERATHDAKKAERQAKKAADKAAGRPTVDTDTGSDASAPRSASPKQKAE